MSPVRHALGAPKLNPPTARMRELDAQAQPLEAELERLRGARCVGIFPPANDRIRELRRQLAAIDRDMACEFRANNPKWVAHWKKA